jgi:PLD-like domain
MQLLQYSLIETVLRQSSKKSQAAHMDIYFLNPAAPETNISQHVLDIISSMIRDTPGLLRIAVAYFTHPDIAQALVERAKRGLATHVLLNTADIIRPAHPHETDFIISQHLIEVVRQGNPLLVRVLGGGGGIAHWTMHHKFMVAQDQAVFGSLNWTISAFTSNFEHITTTTEPQLIGAFIDEHDRLWGQAAVLRAAGAQLQVVRCPDCQATEGIDFQSWGPMCTKCGKRFRLATIEGNINNAAG